MRVTVCELPHEQEQLDASWNLLCEHVAKHRSELILLPEFAFVEPFWEDEFFDASRWEDAVAAAYVWLKRLHELQVTHVVSTRPMSVAAQRYNEGFAWSKHFGYQPLRRKYFLPNEQGSWEANWFACGDRKFSRFEVGELSFGLNICSELWALETYGAYAALGINAILSPRATAARTTDKWLSVGTVAAVRSGAYSLSSNRTHFDGSCGGVGWIISPDGEVLAKTSERSPCCTVDIDLAATAVARRAYPRYLFDSNVDTSCLPGKAPI